MKQPVTKSLKIRADLHFRLKRVTVAFQDKIQDAVEEAIEEWLRTAKDGGTVRKSETNSNRKRKR